VIITLAVWLIALSAAYGYGRLLLPPSPNGDGIDSEFARIYAGLLIVSAILLAAALFTSLTPLVGLLVAVPGVLICWRDRGSNKRFRPYYVVLALIALFISTREINFYDTALYHQQAVKWLAEHGLVRGLALVHFRFGYLSSWFALAAPLDHGVTAGRAGIVGGLPFTLAVVSGSQVLRGLLDRRPVLTTWGILGILLSAVAIFWHLDTSLGTDMMVWLLPLVVVTVLADPTVREADRLGRATAISAMACLIKLTAAPVLAYCLAILLWRFARVAEDRRRLAAFAMLALGALVLLFAANIIISGCPLFPSPLGCVSQNWSVGAETARSIQAEAERFARLPRHSEILPLTAGAALASVLLGAMVRTSYVRYVLGVAWVGIAFTLAVVPVSRYGLGYFLLPIAALSAAVLERAIASAGLRMHEFSDRVKAFAFVTAAVAVVTAVSATTMFNWNLLLYPRRIAAENGDPIHILNRALDANGALAIHAEQRGELTIWIPASSDQCWDAPLPCTPGLTRRDLKFRRKGSLSDGFMTP
jgi:hypothetical protein